MKKCFFYWGGDKLPLLNLLSLISFKKFNPDYKVILYKPYLNFNDATWPTHEQKIKYNGDDYSYLIPKFTDEIRELNLNEIGFPNEVHHSQKADILRQWLMFNEGGWWSDMDVIWLKSISLMGLENNYDLGVCWRNGHHSSGVMFSRPKTVFYENIFNSLRAYFSSSFYQSAGPSLLNNLYSGIESIENSELGIKVYNFELFNFYPILYNELNLLYNQSNGIDRITDNVYGIHWYNGDTLSANFLNLFNVDSIGTSELTIYKILNTILGCDTIKKIINNINE